MYTTSGPWMGAQQIPDAWWDVAYTLMHDRAKPSLNMGFVDGHVDFVELLEFPDHFSNQAYDLAQY